MTVDRDLQAKIVAQGAAAVLVAEQAALLQDRHDQFGEILQAVGQQRVDDETVRRTFFEPLLNRVGDVLGGADEIPARP
ncbi:hypothetical protein D3C85_1731820 [compost metagenome]